MDSSQVGRLLRPEKFCVEPNTPNSSQCWIHWLKTFNIFLKATKVEDGEIKLQFLINYVGPTIYSYIENCDSYEEALEILNCLFIKAKNEVFARHVLSTRRQQVGESLDLYLNSLKQLSKDCNFKAVTADENRDDYIRDAFISGILSTHIRQRLLENSKLSLTLAFDQARALELAQKQSESYNINDSAVYSVSQSNESSNLNKERSECRCSESVTLNATSSNSSPLCYFCGNTKHARSICPARNSICHGCKLKGHFFKVCNKSKVKYGSENERGKPSTSSIVAAAPQSLSKATIQVNIDGIPADALVDTGSSLTFVSSSLVRMRKLKVFPSKGSVNMASTSLTSQIEGVCVVDIEILGHTYHQFRANILKELCADIIVGHDILKQHSQLQLNFGGNRAPLSICSLDPALIPPVSLFSNLTVDCKPIAVKSRRQSESDSKFIQSEVERLLSDGIIEESASPWRAQAFVINKGNHKRRMVIDYSQTINKFTLLDAYPQPRVEDVINKVSQYKVFSTIDLKSAYHQIPIREEERPLTAFEACGKLFQFCRIPFGVTNGVPTFQRTIDGIIETEGLTDVFSLLDDVTICGKTQTDHDNNLSKFLNVCKKYNLTLNKQKCKFSTTSVVLLGYKIEHGTVSPDPERLQTLKDLPPPNCLSSLKRTLGLFSYYSKWIPQFSEKVRPLTAKKSFPLDEKSVKAFNELKEYILQASIYSIDDQVPFTVETDASEFAIGATLSQSGRPVAFFSRTLSHSEQRHSSIEKEAQAIFESVQKWRHFLIGKHFSIVTDQRSVSYMFDLKHSSKIKNEKIMRWRLELSCYSFDIIYRPGKLNVAADSLSRINASIHPDKATLTKLHSDLCHPGITRLHHYVRSKNLPFSLEDVKSTTRSCRVCAEIKPQFHRHSGHLIKATQPFERLNLDFKGPLPSATRNKFLLTIVDEHSRFPFAFPCSDLSSSSVISHLHELFTLFGIPAYIHSDRGSAFMSKELKDYLTRLGVATSRTTPYNPQGNGLVERYNGIIWRTISLALKSKNMKINLWENVLHESLHAVRSLLCTSTNETPHERMFKHSRRTTTGSSVPSFLTNPGPVLLRKHVRASKYDPGVQEVQLLECNPDYAYVRMPDGRETSVSVRHLAPRGEERPFEKFSHEESQDHEHNSSSESNTLRDQISEPELPHLDNASPTPSQVRRSQRNRHPPAYLNDYETY